LLRKKYKRIENVQITALTGIAAVNIDGCTLHSYSGFGHKLDRFPVSNTALYKWKNTKVLIIDEVSMLTSGFFKKLYFLH